MRGRSVEGRERSSHIEPDLPVVARGQFHREIERFATMDNDLLEEAINDLSSGAAVCFLGAGFSLDAYDSSGKSHVPSVEELCSEICKFPGLQSEQGASLTDLADYCEQDDQLKPRLRSLLLQRLTLCQPSDTQRHILKMPWRAVFTTNFDDVAEVAMRDENPAIVTPAFDVKNLRPDRKPLYYLHGRALDILNGAADPSIVISETNYLEIKEKNRNLYAALENEVHAASRIFFIGYSIRDAEIASRLFHVEGLKEKSIVISGPNERLTTRNRLLKFGEVIPIGISGLAQKLPKSIAARSSISIDEIRFLKAIKPSPAKEQIEPSDIEKLLLTGQFSYEAYANQQTNPHLPPEYCIPRSRKLDVFFDPSHNVNRFIVSSDIGNGKSIFLNQLAYEAHHRGYEVVEVTTELPEALTELDSLLAGPSRRVYLVDGLIRHRRAIQHIGKRLPGNSMLVVAAGQTFDEAAHSDLVDLLNGTVREVDIDNISDQELDQWNSFLERWGYWEGRIEDSELDRFKFLKERCGGETRSIILSLFKESSLSRKIAEIVSFFLNRNRELSRPFISVLINALCQKHVEWSRIVEWVDIDEQAFKRAVMSSPVSNFMVGTRRWNEFTSTELASYIFSKYEFPLEEVVDVYTLIVRNTAFSANDPRSGFDARENLKELMRFRFLTRLFDGQPEAGEAINAVYHRLSNVPRIRNHDQFWLQYAMARMEVYDLANAETYLNTALGIAAKKDLPYSRLQIIDQQVRLLFRKNAKLGKINTREILDAIEKLTELLTQKGEPIIHPLRSAEPILSFLEAKADDIDGNLLPHLRSLVTLMKSKLPEQRLEKSQRGETESIRKTLLSCLLILNGI